MTDIYEYRRKTINKIEDLISAGGLSSYEITDKIKELSKDNPDLKDWADRMATWRDIIYNSNDAAFIDKVYDNSVEFIKSIMKEKHEKEMDKEKKRHQENVDWWKEHYRKINESEQANKEWWRKYNAKEHDWQKDIEKSNEENKKRIENDRKDWIEENKKDDIDKVESELRKTKVSEVDLNKRLGVNDWREKINQTSDIIKSQRRRFEIEDEIEKLSKEIVCDYCKETKIPYPASSYEIPSKKKKFCSLDCQDAWKKENDYTPTPNEKKRKWSFNLVEFFDMMKKLGIEGININPNSNEITIKYKNNKTGKLEDSKLSSELKSQVKKEMEARKESITFSQIEKELGENDNKKGNGGIIAAIVIIGIILAVVIGVVIHKNKKRDY